MDVSQGIFPKYTTHKSLTFGYDLGVFIFVYLPLALNAPKFW